MTFDEAYERAMATDVRDWKQAWVVFAEFLGVARATFGACRKGINKTGTRQQNN